MSHNVTSSRFKTFCLTNSPHELPGPSTTTTNLNRDRALTPPPPSVNADPNTDTDLDLRTDHSSIPHVNTAMSANGALRCCCGRPSCAYLEHNNESLAGLERDLETAARLGQVNTTILVHIKFEVNVLGLHQSVSLLFSGPIDWRLPLLQYIHCLLPAFPSSLTPEGIHVSPVMALPPSHIERLSKCAPNVNSGGLTFALQALLHRHESYMASSESERMRLSAAVAILESEKISMQATNDRIIAENRALLDRLEELNTTHADTDAHVKSLEATLASANLEMRRLAGLADKVGELERQLVEMERGRSTVEEELDVSKEDERSALRRWREAEGRVRGLEAEVTRIEREIAGERDRHAEVLGRMERRGFVEKNLLDAEGRPKRAAAAMGLGESGTQQDGDGRTNVVSHFVRDILGDNANLQAGIVELRELLQTSNEEVQNLREQIMQHQPVGVLETTEDDATPLVSLEEQLWDQHPQQQVSQEVHVHHHYHAKFSAKREKVPATRRHSKKRTSIGLGLLGSTPESSVPATPIVRPHRHVSSPLLQDLSMKQPISRASGKRWSMQSAATGSTLSSLPSSPRSYFDRPSEASIFDRLEREEYSRPTSPESAGGYGSPGMGHRKGKHSEFSLMSFKDMNGDGNSETPLVASPILGTAAGASIVKIDEDVIEQEEQKSPLDTTGDLQTHFDDPTDVIDTQQPEPLPPEPDETSESLATFEDADIEEIRPLRRSASHDSLVSISGMDIHIAKRKPSQVFVISRGLSSPSMTRASPGRTISASQPLATIAEVTASSATRSFSSHETSASLAMLSGLAGTPSKTAAVAQPVQALGLGRFVGGWVRGRWGVAPVKSSGDLRAQAVATMFAGRPPGINQPGGIPGLRPPLRTPSEIHAKVLDERLLRESLAE